jgi:hypothetical protein
VLRHLHWRGTQVAGGRSRGVGRYGPRCRLAARRVDRGWPHASEHRGRAGGLAPAGLPVARPASHRALQDSISLSPPIRDRPEPWEHHRSPAVVKPAELCERVRAVWLGVPRGRAPAFDDPTSVVTQATGGCGVIVMVEEPVSRRWRRSARQPSRISPAGRRSAHRSAEATRPASPHAPSRHACCG